MRLFPSMTIAALGMALTLVAATAKDTKAADDDVAVADDQGDESPMSDQPAPAGYAAPVLDHGMPMGHPAPYGADSMDCWGCPPSNNFAAGFHAPPQCSKVWGAVEFLYWQPRGMDTPPLVTTSPVGTPQAIAGELGQPTTTIIYGNSEINDEYRTGARLNLGFWLAPDEMVGIEGHALAFEDEETLFTAVGTFSNGGTGPILAQPFFNVDAQANDALLLAFPNFQTGNQTINLDGTINVQSEQSIQSAGLLMRRISWMDVLDSHGVTLVRIYGLAGYRYFRLGEELGVDSVIRPVGGSFGNNSSITTSDFFEVENNFHGGELGLEMQVSHGSFFLKLLTKAALGNVHERINIDGSTVSSDGVNTTTFAGGLLAQPTNIGDINSDRFAVLPEANITLGCQLTRNVAVTGGYTFLYLSNVVRAGDQIDQSLNPTQFDGGVLIGEARPTANINTSEFWMHGFNAGVEITW